MPDVILGDAIVNVKIDEVQASASATRAATKAAKIFSDTLNSALGRSNSFDALDKLLAKPRALKIDTSAANKSIDGLEGRLRGLGGTSLPPLKIPVPNTKPATDAIEKLARLTADTQKLSIKADISIGKSLGRDVKEMERLRDVTIEVERHRRKLGDVAKLNLSTNDLDKAKKSLDDLHQKSLTAIKIKYDNSGMNDLKKSLNDMMEGIARGAAASIGHRLVGGITSAVRGLGDLAGGAIGGSLQTFGVYDKTITDFGLKAEATDEQVKKFKQTIADMSTTRSATELAAAGVEMAKLGFTADQTSDSLKSITNMADATGLKDLGKAATITATGMQVFQLSAEKVNDVITTLANKTAIDPSDFMQGFAKDGALFQSTGQSIEDLAYLMGALKDSGYQAQEAAGALKTSLIQLTDPSDKGQNAMDKIGLKVFDATGKFKGLGKILEETKDKMKGLSDEQRLPLLNQIFGRRGGAAAQSAMNYMGTEKSDSLKSALDNSDGIAETGASLKGKGFAGSIARLKKELQDIQIQFGEALGGVISKIADMIGQVSQKLEGAGLFDKLAEGAKTFSDYLEKNPQIIDQIATAIGQLATEGFTFITDQVKLFTQNLEKNPQLIQETLDRTVELIDDLAQLAVFAMEFGKGFAETAIFITGLLSPLGEMVGALTGSKDSSASLAENLGKAAGWLVVLGGVVSVANTLSAIAGYATSIAGLFGGWPAIWASIQGAVTAIGAALGGTVAAAVGTIALALGAIAITVYNIVQYATNWGDVCLGVQQTLTDIDNWVKSIIGNSKILNGVWDGIKGILSYLVNPLGAIYGSIDQSVQKTGFFKDQWNGMKQTFENVFGWINDKVIQPIISAKEHLAGLIGMGGKGGDNSASGGGEIGVAQLPGSLSGQLDASGQNGADMGVGDNGEMQSYHNGRVIELGKAGNNGNYIVLEFIDEMGNKLEATYSHVEAAVKKGDWVKGGQVIGKFDGSGRTFGAHNSIDVNTPGTNGALQRSQEREPAKRSADLLVKGIVQGVAQASSGGGATQGAVDDWIQSLMYIKEGEGTNIALENRAAGDYGGFGTSLAKQALASGQFEAFKEYQGTNQFDSVAGVKQAAASYGITEADLINAGKKAKQNYSRDRGVIGNRTSFRTAGSFDGSNSTPHQGNWYLNEEVWDGVDRRPKQSSGGSTSSSYQSTSSGGSGSGSSNTSPMMMNQSSAQQTKHVVIPLDHTRRRIPDKAGGSTYNASGQTGAAYAGYTERDYQDPAAAKLKTMLQDQGYKVTIMRPEDFNSFEEYDSKLAKLADSGAIVTPLHFDAKGGGYLTRSKAGDAEDNKLSNAIFNDMKKALGSNASTRFQGPDTEANMTINAAGKAPATLVELGAMSDMVDRYKTPQGYMKSDEVKQALSGVVSGINRYTQSSGSGNIGGGTIDSSGELAEIQTRKEEEAEKKRRQALEEARRYEDSETKARRAAKQKTRENARKIELAELETLGASIDDPGMKQSLAARKEQLTTGAASSDRIDNLNDELTDLRSALKRKQADLKVGGEVAEKAKLLPNYSKAIAETKTLIAQEIALRDALLGTGTAQNKAAIDQEKLNQARAKRDADREKEYLSNKAAAENTKSALSAMGAPTDKVSNKIEEIELTYKATAAVQAEIDKRDDLNRNLQQYQAILGKGKTDDRIKLGEGQIKEANAKIAALKEKYKNDGIILNIKVSSANREADIIDRDTTQKLNYDDKIATLKTELALGKQNGDQYAELIQLDIEREQGLYDINKQLNDANDALAKQNDTVAALQASGVAIDDKSLVDANKKLDAIRQTAALINSNKLEFIKESELEKLQKATEISDRLMNLRDEVADEQFDATSKQRRSAIDKRRENRGKYDSTAANDEKALFADERDQKIKDGREAIEKTRQERAKAGYKMTAEQVQNVTAAMEEAANSEYWEKMKGIPNIGRDIAQSFGDGVTGALKDLILTGKSLGDVLSNLFSNLASQLLDIGLGSIGGGGGLGGLLGGLFGGGKKGGGGGTAPIKMSGSFLPTAYDGGIANYANGNPLGSAISDALRREQGQSGRIPMLAAINRGEAVIDADTTAILRKTLGSSIRNFAGGNAAGSAIVAGLGNMAGGGRGDFNFGSGAIVINSNGNSKADAEEILRQMHEISRSTTYDVLSREQRDGGSVPRRR